MIIGISASIHGTGKTFLGELLHLCNRYSVQAFGDALKLEINDLLTGTDSSFFLMLDKIKKVNLPKEEEDALFNLCLKYRNNFKLEYLINTEKKKEFRRLMQVWGTDVRRFNNDKYWIPKINWYIKDFCITDVRFKNELEYIRQLSGKTVYLLNPLHKETIDIHESERLSSSDADLTVLWSRHLTMLETFKAYQTICISFGIETASYDTFTKAYEMIKEC